MPSAIGSVDILKELWDEIVKFAPPNTLTGSDRFAVESLVVSLSALRRSYLVASGTIIGDPIEYAGAMKAMKEYLNQVRHWTAALGLTPVARKHVRPPVLPAPADEFSPPPLSYGDGPSVVVTSSAGA